jgi:hypothetical protein
MSADVVFVVIVAAAAVSVAINWLLNRMFGRR